MRNAESYGSIEANDPTLKVCAVLVKSFDRRSVSRRLRSDRFRRFHRVLIQMTRRTSANSSLKALLSAVAVFLVVLLTGCPGGGSGQESGNGAVELSNDQQSNRNKGELWCNSEELPDNAAMMLGQPRPYEHGGSSMVFSPDGKTVVSWGQRYFKKRRVSDGKILFEKQFLSGAGGVFLDETRFFGCTSSAGFIVDDEVRQLFLLSQHLRVSSVAVSGIHGIVATGLSQQSGSPYQAGEFRMETADGSIRFWSAKDGSYLYEIHPELGTIHDIALLQSSRQIAIVGDDALELWSYLDGKHTRLASVEKPADAVLTLSQNGFRIALTRNDVGVIDIWDTTSVKLVATKMVGPNEAKAVAFDRVGNVIYGGDSGRVNFWDFEKDEIVRVVETDAHVTAIAVSPDGSHFAASAWNVQHSRHFAHRDDFRIWSLDPLKELTKCPGHANAVTDVCFTSDGERVVTASQDRTAMVWDAESGSLLRQIGKFHAPQIGEFHTPTRDQTSISLTADSQSVIISEGQQLTQVNLATGKTIKSFSPVGGAIYDAVLSNDQDLLVVLSQDTANTELASDWFATFSSIHIRKYPDGDVIRSIPTRFIEGQITLTADSKYVIVHPTFSDSRGINTVVWRVEDGVQVAAFRVGQFAFSSRTDSFVCARERKLELWSIDGWQFDRAIAECGPCYAMALSPDGALLAAGIQTSGSFDINIYNVAEGTLMWQQNIKNHNSLNSIWKISFSPDGTKLAAGFENSSTLIWNLPKEIHPQEGVEAGGA
jgi:WD40 repeat protein